MGLVHTFLALSLRTGEPAVPSPALPAIVVSGEEVFLMCPAMAATGLGVPCSPQGPGRPSSDDTDKTLPSAGAESRRPRAGASGRGRVLTC